MNILLVAPWDQKRGGVAWVVGNLARHLESQGHSVMFFVPGETNCLEPFRTAWGFPGVRGKLRGGFNRSHPLRSVVAFTLFLPVVLYDLIHLLRRNQIQIVNVHYPVEQFLYFALCRALVPFKLVTSVHGSEVFPGGKPPARYAWGLKLLLRASDLVVAPAQGALERLLKVWPQLRGRSTYIYNGVRPEEWVGEPVARLSDRGGRVLNVAAHQPVKGLDVLLRAMALLRRRVPHARLLLAGDGPARSELEALARQLQLEQCVEFLGLQSDQATLRTLLQSCDVFVLPSRSESFPIALMEAMACARPVVATKVGGVPELVASGFNGLLVEPESPSALAEGLRVLLEDPGLRERLGANGRRTIQQRFVCEATGRAYEATFANLLDVTAGGGRISAVRAESRSGAG